MEIEQATKFLAALGSHHLEQTSNGWAACKCPLAIFTHAGGKDNNPSFAVTIGPEKSNFNCYTCEKGSLVYLLQLLEFYSKQYPQHASRYNFKAARAILDEDISAVVPLPAYTEFSLSPYGEFEPWPEWFLEDFPKWDSNSTSAQYIRNTREITEETANLLDLRMDNHRGMVVAPFRTASGLLAGMRGRRIETQLPHRTPLKHYDYAWNKVRNTALTWFNERAFNLPGPLVIVEGQFDLARLYPYWKKTVAILSSKTTLYKMKKLEDAGKEGVVLLFDNPHIDVTAGKRYPEWESEMIRRGIKYSTAEYPEKSTWKDPGEAPEAWLQEIGQELTNL